LIGTWIAPSGRDDDVVWLALAVSASEIGRLDNDTRDRAVAIVDRVKDVSDERATELARVRAQLVGPQPRRKQVRGPRRQKCGLHPGDVLALQCDGSWRLLRVAFVEDHELGETPTVQLLDFDGPSVPGPSALAHLADDTTATAGLRTTSWRYQALKPYDGWRDAGFELLGNCGRVDPFPNTPRSTKWTAIANRLRTLER
jgi:hypothetical protein